MKNWERNVNKRVRAGVWTNAWYEANGGVVSADQDKVLEGMQWELGRFLAKIIPGTLTLLDRTVVGLNKVCKALTETIGQAEINAVKAEVKYSSTTRVIAVA